jgi:AraC family transcriptional regulator of adaptative response / DNA-3-methyladenine glycosylase II
MNLDPQACYRALRTRDRRFDGRFFTGVTSTGVYCRPVCPARTPKSGNCRFFPHATAAEEAGFRPCMRCRPETSPGTPAWQGASATVSRALRLIDDGALDGGGVEDLAERVGIGSRHLRRLFDEHLGVGPLAVAMTRRVHFAKRLLEETDLPILQIAHTTGFNNARRFNAAFRDRFERPPSAIRRAASHERDGGTLGLRLSYRPPFDWETFLNYMSPRLIPGVEEVVGNSYKRTIALEGIDGRLEISPDRASKILVLEVPVAAAPHLFEIVARMRRFLDLTADPDVIDGQLESDPLLADLAVPRGLRVPGAWDSFELAIRTILGQQVTVKSATTLSGRLVQAFGRKLDQPGSPGWIFPAPESIANASPKQIAAIGMPEARAAAIRGLAHAVADSKPVLEPAASLEEAVARLTALEGIGEWSANYIAMRALREPDAFPAGDLGLRRALVGDGRPMAARALARQAEAWRPWRAYAAIRLWTALTLRMEKR